ncbi:MAG: GNAT family protein [Gammaproteobacteria bacterium]|nr:GNAT family protein [Gammaproteobacteria bacterium]
MELLTGKACCLKTFDESHLNNSDYLKWVRDYDVIKMLNKIDYLRPVSFEEVKQYCTNVMQSPNDMFYALYEKEADKFIGTVRVSKINWHNKVADLGIMIGDKSYWGKGIASDAIKSISLYLFRKCGLRKLTAGYMDTNPAMGKVFEKLGFKKEGTFRKQDYFEGKYVDHIYMGCFSDEFVFES